jgi:signal transduction histidine kinase
MTDLAPIQLASVALNATAAVVWGSVALREAEVCRLFRPRNRLFPLLRNMTVLGTIHYLSELAVWLVPAEIARPTPPTWLHLVYILDDWSLILVAPVAWHLTRYWGTDIDPPGRVRSALVWLSAVAVMVLTLGFPSWLAGFGNPLQAYFVIRNTYLLAAFGFAVRRMIRGVRRGRWRPGTAGANIVAGDVWMFGGGVIVMGIVLAMLASGDPPDRVSARGFAIDLAITALVTVPIAARELTHVVRGLLFVGGVLAVTTVTFFGGRGLVTRLVGPDVPRIADLTTILLTVGVLLPAQAGLRDLIDRRVLKRRAYLWNDLRTFIATLSPEAGVTACCRRVLVEVVRVLGLTGAAIVLRDGDAIVEGTFDVEPLRRTWPRGDALDALPPSLVSLDYLTELPRPVVDALVASEVVVVLPITSPRRRWGALFATSGLLEPVPEENDPVDAFVGQLALLLDAVALLERTVAVERSLAHAEKLAAIGELAARVAHEIRNPVTAARSLAQLLVRDPTAPENAEHATLILGELERVEAQVRGLLQFARREEYRFEPIDLAELVRTTLDPMRRRLEDAKVTLDAAVPSGIVVRADREKLRQVLANLVDNALDAVAGVPVAHRRLSIAVGTTNGTASLEVRDTGPGIPDAARAHVFEPFFSQKPNGTGLGLAIARRTIEAHGGRIATEPAEPHGTVFRVDLPTQA